MTRFAFLATVATSLLLNLAACAGGPLLPAVTPPAPLPEVTPLPLPLPSRSAATSMPTPAQTPTPELSGYVGGMVLIAWDAAREGDWEQVKEELDEAVDLSTDVRTRALFDDLLTALADGDTAHVLAELERLADVVSGESPLLTELEDALRFAQIGDWEEVADETKEALDLTTDLRIQAALKEIQSDLEQGQHQEVLHDLERLVSGVGVADPALPSLQEAMKSAKAGDWEQVRALLREAAGLTADSQHLASIIEMLDDLEKGNYEEVLSDLSLLIGAHGQMDPARGELQTALRHARRDEWDKVREKLAEAEELSRDPQQKEAIAALLESLDQGQREVVVKGLETILQR